MKTNLTSILFLIFGWLAACVAGSFTAFAMAIFFRCILRAWKLGWLMFSLLAVTAVQATPVWFPLLGITGSANNRDILVTPDPVATPLVYNSNLVSLQSLVIHPVRGNATNELLPLGYTLRVDGWPRSAHFVVPNQTNVANVTTLITNALAIGYPMTGGGFTGRLTNTYPVVTSSASGFLVSGAGVALANGFYSNYPALNGYYINAAAETIQSAWTNNARQMLVVLSSTSASIILNSTNAETAWASGYLYEDTGAGWTTVGGTNPAPSVVFTNGIGQTNWLINYSYFTNGVLMRVSTP